MLADFQLRGPKCVTVQIDDLCYICQTLRVNISWLVCVGSPVCYRSQRVVERFAERTTDAVLASHFHLLSSECSNPGAKFEVSNSLHMSNYECIAHVRKFALPPWCVFYTG